MKKLFEKIFNFLIPDIKSYCVGCIYTTKCGLEKITEKNYTSFCGSFKKS